MGRTSGNRPPRPAAGGPGARTDRCRPRSDSLPCGGGGGGEGWLIPPPGVQSPSVKEPRGWGGSSPWQWQLLPCPPAPMPPPGPREMARVGGWEEAGAPS